MLREMSSLRIFRRASQKHVPHEETENGSEKPSDSNLPSTAMAGSMRAPLCPLSEQQQKLAGVCTENFSGSRRFDGTPTKTKGKGCAKADDSELPPFTSPQKNGSVPSSTTNVNNRNRFGWPQRHDTSSRETNITNGRRSPLLRDNRSEISGDTNFTPQSLNNAFGNEANHANGNGIQSNRGFVVGNGGSNNATPRPIKTGGKASSNQSDCGSTSSTPTKSVSRALNNGASVGTATNSFRFPTSQNSVARTGHPCKTLVVASAPPTVVNTVEVPHFELKEDPAFWMDHNVQVLLRIRPLNSAEVASQGYSRCLKQESAHSITFLGPPETRFTFDHVACETTTQEMLFKVAGLPMVENCMSGYNSCMFAYGQTGSGKTHTMLGDINELDQRPSANRGMTPRIFEYLFARIRAEEESHMHEQLRYVCKCSFLEIYNEQITDLLEPSSTNLQLREDVRKGVYVDNLTEFEVNSVQDVVRLLFLGAANRKVAATNMNRESSRSHSVFTCVIESHWEKDSMTNIRYGRLNLVDLAGSERQKSSGAEGERLKEAANINKSLSTLGLVIMILVDVANGKQRHVPYRDSRLTFLLQDSLGGNSKTTIIANISPSLCSANETLSTLKFAQRAKFIQNNAIVNEDASGDVMALQLQIQQLKEELSFFKRQNVSRSLAFRSTIFSESKPGNGEGNMTVVPGYNVDVPDCSLDLLPNLNSLGSPRISSKKLKSLEATLMGALRRENVAETTTRRLEAEIEHLNRLVRQREEDTQCTKMMLRFREDKIRRLESVADGLISSDAYLLEEKNALFEELQLVRGRLDRNPELTRFAMENIRLLEQLRKYQDFYEGGERENLLAEVSDLRDQLLEVLEGKFEQEKSPRTFSTPEVVISPELACVTRENDMLRSEVDNTRKEIEDCRNHLSACLEVNEKMSREIDELHLQLDYLKATCYQQQNDLEALRSQSIAAGTVEEENGQEQIIDHLKEQVQTEMELRTKIDDAQASVRNNRHDLQEKTQREQELEMRHSEEIMQLQLEIETIETILEEERLSRKEAEERVMQLSQNLEAASEKSLQVSKDLEAALEKVNDGKSVIEALESQQLFSINEIENLQVRNREILELLNKKEEERQMLENKSKILNENLNIDKELGVLEKQRKDNCSENVNNEHSSMQVKLERMQRALEKARKLNMRLQNEQASQTSHEEEMDNVRRQVETETAEVIICLQEELVALRQQVDSTTARESEKNEHLTHLEGEIEELKYRLTFLTEENDRLVSMTAEKDSEIKELKDEWEKAAIDLTNCLAEGDQALEDASEQMESIMDSFPHKRLKIDQGVERVVAIISEKEKVIDTLQKRLQHAQNLARDTEGKMRSLQEATLTITEVQQRENDDMSKEACKMRSELSQKISIIQGLESEVVNCQNSIREAEKRSSAAFIMVKKLTELNDGMSKEVSKVRLELSQKISIIQGLERELTNCQSDIREAEKRSSAAFIVVKKYAELNDGMSKEVSKVRSELFLKSSIIEGLESEIANSQSRMRETEKCASAAFIVSKKLTELNESQREAAKSTASQLDEALEASRQKGKLVQDMQNELLEARLQIDSLKQLILKTEKESDELKLVLASEQDKVKVVEKKAEVSEENIWKVVDEVEKSWQKVFEVETKLCSYVGSIEKELSASKADSMTTFDDFKRQVQNQFEEVHALKDELMCKLGNQTQVIEKAMQTINDLREKENQLILAFVDAILAARKMQHRNNIDARQLSERESSLKCANEKLKMAEIELKERDQQVHELTVALEALEIAKSNVELEKLQLVIVADQATSRCLIKEQELHVAKQEFSFIHAKLKELEDNACFVNARMDHSLKQLKCLEEHSKLLVGQDVQKKLDDERQELHSEKECVEEEMTRKQMTVTEEFGATQCKVKMMDDNIIESTLTTEALIEKISHVEKEALLKDAAIARDKVSNKEKELLFVHNTLTEVQQKLKLADDNVDALEALINDFACSEEHRRIERQSLSSKIEHLQAVLLEKENEVEVLRNQQVTEISGAVSKSALAENINNVTIASEVEKMKIETENLKTILYEKDQTILSVRKEMEAALASLKEAELEMKRTLDENEELTESVEMERCQIEGLTNEIKHLREDINHKQTELDLLQAEMVKILEAMEERTKETEATWRKEKEILSLELNNAKLVAAEKTSEAVTMLRKFEESQETIKEADLMLNALLRANENAKHDTERWKNVEEEFVTERGSLIDEIERAKIAFTEKEQQVVSMQEQIQMKSQETRDLISDVEKFVMNSIRVLEEEIKTINAEIGSLKQDVLHALDANRSLFEELWSIVAEKDSTMFLLHSCQVEALLGKIHMLNIQVVSLNKKLIESNASKCQLEENNTQLQEEVAMHIGLGANIQVEIKSTLGNIIEKETRLERLLGQLNNFEKKISVLEVQENSMMGWSTAKDVELANLISEVEKKHIEVDAATDKIEKLKGEKEELCAHLDHSFKKISILEREQESFQQSMHTEIDLLHLQLHESNERATKSEKHNKDLNDEIKQYGTAILELQEDLTGRPEGTFKSVKGRESLSGQLQLLKMEVSDLKIKEEMLRKELMAKESQMAILCQEVDGHGKVQSNLDETLQLVDNLQKEKQELSFALDQSNKMIRQLENEKAAFQQDELRLKERLDSLVLENGQSCESVVHFQKLSADADENLKKKDGEIEAMQKKLEEVAVNSMYWEQERKGLQERVGMLEISLDTLQSDFDVNKRELIELQLAHSTALEHLENKHQEVADLMSKLNASEMENMGLRNEIDKQMTVQDKLCSELQQSNDVAAEIKREHAESAELLKVREGEVTMLIQQKEDISNKLYGMENENKELKEALSRQNHKLQEFTIQIALIDDNLKQLSRDSCDSILTVENLEGRLYSLPEKVLSAMSTKNADEEQLVDIENILQYTCVLEEKTHVFLDQMELIEMKFEELLSQNASLHIELKRKEEVINGLQFDLSLLQESASKAKDQKDEVQEATAALKLVQEDLLAKSNELTKIRSDNNKLEIKLKEKESESNRLKVDLAELKENLASVSKENSQLASDVEDLLKKNNSAEEELEEKQKLIEGLEEELLEMSSLVDHQTILSIESMKCELNNVTRERDRLQAETLVLNEQLEMTQAFADEREAIAVEARQKVAEARKIYAEEKEEEAKLLERSVEELERTVNALESQVDIVKREADRQRLMREDIELELQALRHQMLTMQSIHSTGNNQNASDSMGSVTTNQRPIVDKQLEQRDLHKHIKNLEKEIEEKNAEIKKCKAHIEELTMNAEIQANEYQQKYKALEAMAIQVKAEQSNSNAVASSSNKLGEKTATKPRGSGSPFKCIGLGLAHQMHSERDEELQASRHRIEELETFLAARQKEIFMLNSRLAAAESMTHDVIRDLLGVKLDMTNYASVLDNQQVQKIAEKARRQNEESQEKEQEVLKLKHQLNELIEERESWLDEINRRQAEMVAARVAAEKLRQRDQFLTTENEMLKADNSNQKRRLIEIEEEIKKLSGQQNLQQRIHHHAKIKEENNVLRAQYEDISAKLRRTEVLLARVSDELARYRTADGKSPYISIDEEQRLRNKLQETEEERVQMAQKLLGLCNSILQAAGIVRPPREIDPSLAVETLQQLKERLESAEREIRDLKLKMKIAGEKMKLSELRQQSTSPSSVKTNDKSFTSVQQSCPSPSRPNLR
ncbi:kinesin-like protein KIN-12F isoform X1 [Cryptomeria japonica]|uniref:kinesin-like protein KIN-12F isoform X1 n=1 Tax=Cryptomeria japonica TaxID=3369 RepID=UPI0027DA51C2|nr:kinesin-like protein KIN-12F isoform X1 [Cryptomeria japonica]